MVALSFGAALYAWAEPGSSIDREWAPTWGFRLHFEVDGLANLYSILATGIGLAVAIYASGYMPLHLHHEHRPERDIVRFYGFLLLFMGAMVGLVLAQDTFLIFLFWDLTAIASYFLIGYDNQKQEARVSALMALLVTGVSAIGFLIGALVLANSYGTYQLPELFARAQPGRELSIAAGLMMVAALAKSAQFPFHFWLPRAMAAPTPVSAYLHSAAMVAAGVFLIGRIYPLIEPSETLLTILLLVGIASILTGGVLALTRDNMKQLLAYSTISQYGYVVMMFGIGGKYGIGAASFYVIAHALAKSALFLTAGTVAEATGAKELSSTGGLWRQMPGLAAGSAAAAAGLAALPLTIGFFKDELFFKAAANEGPWIQSISVLAATLTFTYMARFWFGIFGGKPGAILAKAPAVMVIPVIALGVLTIIGGIWPNPFVRLAETASDATLLTPVEIQVKYALTASAENVMAVVAIGLGTFLFLTSKYWAQAAAVPSKIGSRIGPEHAYSTSLYRLNQFSDRIHWIEVRDLRSRIATVLLPAAVLVGLALIFSDVTDVLTFGEIKRGDLPLALLIIVVALAAVTAAVPRDHFSMALALSGVGFGLAVVYSLLTAPDVALVAVLIETIFGLLIFGFLALLPRGIDHAEVVPSDDPKYQTDSHEIRDAVVAIIAGAFAFVVAWGVLSKPAALESVIEDHIALTPEAHGKAVVTVILADFRGLDTLGEITVIAVAFLGIATLMRRRVSQ